MTESLKLQPKDRDYNKNGGKREVRFESIGGSMLCAHNNE